MSGYRGSSNRPYRGRGGGGRGRGSRGGSPPEWLDKITPYIVEEDTSECFVDQNGFRISASPLLPLIASVDFHHANEAKPFDWSSVDIITDRNGLRKLLRWIQGDADRDFRIDLQLAGKKTILFTRWEKHTKEYPMFSGTFGHNFEEASTKPAKGCEGSSGHHRVVHYNFGGLNMVVRSEVDAYRPAPGSSRSPLAAQRGSGIDDITAALQKTSIQTTTAETQRVSSGDTTLLLQKAGTVVPQESIAELKTASVKKLNTDRVKWDEIVLQMSIAQTPHLFLGVHDRGNFEQVQKKMAASSPELKAAEARVEPALLKLRRVLEDIKRLVITNGRLSLICRDGKLDVVERISRESCLPVEFLSKFDE
ncbi:hypothetical protein AAF712_008823 [Marasmius tenuissimus]|uniref:Uncharacterized protein n=1 Tax=Marasmius tenuissimus TaxID=585030 RepID=A0ABR2ZS53_9AGAR